jgi:hypothetical protein
MTNTFIKDTSAGLSTIKFTLKSPQASSELAYGEPAVPERLYPPASVEKRGEKVSFCIWFFIYPSPYRLSNSLMITLNQYCLRE